MNDKRYQYILYIISAVIAATIAIQVYWNYKNYLNNKQQLKTDVQVSLDKAVDDYYARVAERSTFGIFLEGDQQKDALRKGGEIERLMLRFDSINPSDPITTSTDSLKFQDIKGITILKGKRLDSMEETLKINQEPFTSKEFKDGIDNLKQIKSQNNQKDIELLTSKIIVSITNDSLNIAEVDSLLTEEFKRKEITINHNLKFYKSSVARQVAKIKDTLYLKSKVRTKDQIPYELTAVSKSTFLPKGGILELGYSNTTLTVLKRSLSGILISAILILAVIACLFYLLKIIKRQKQLAEVKNDLISNITHEFKTPIATIGVALESISNFNGIEDKDKTRKYVDMSSQQLDKLNLMVEKLLETATLDSDKLNLNFKSINVSQLVSDIYNRFVIQFPEKNFHLTIKSEHHIALLDEFHFENAINNILDNAVKYGGSDIFIDLNPKSGGFELSIADNGGNLSKAHKERIFEKFYRIPKGNTHDVKGFGIGLFYTKTIIEKHQGSINVEVNNKLTSFKITIPNG